jgi:nucleoside-triphosphatase
MDLAKKNILISGIPGIGKTTLIKKLIEELKDFRPIGFYTEEIRGKGIRKGFELISLDGRKAILSHTKIKSPYSIGKYRVDVIGFENFLDAILFFSSAAGLVIIDEIGKMECFSNKFRKLIKETLDSERMVIATIANKGEGTIEEIKRRADIRLYEITQSNRDLLLPEIIKDVRNLAIHSQ